MPATLAQVANDARSLAPAERDKLLAMLIHDLHPGEDLSAEEIEKAWDVEIGRRLEEIDSGKVKAIPAEQVFARLRAKLDEAD